MMSARLRPLTLMACFALASCVSATAVALQVAQANDPFESAPPPRAWVDPAIARRAEAERKRVEDGEANLRLTVEQRRQIQSWLVVLGHLQRPTDGVFDGATRAAIVEYQRKAALAENGYLSAPLLDALTQEGRAAIAVVEEIRRIAELKRLEEQENELKLSSEQRRQIQQWLAVVTRAPIEATGDIDPKTREAIRTYQRAKKERETGFLSRALLTSLTSEGQAAVAATEAARRAQDLELEKRAAEAEKKRLEDTESALRLTQEQRRQLQGWLIALGYATRPADGVIDAATRTAIRAFQRRMGDAETGYLTDRLLEALNAAGTAAIAQAEEQRKEADLKRLADAEADLRLSTDQRRQLQGWLAALGHGDAAVSGEIDEATRRGLRAFQRSRKEPETGYLSRGLLNALAKDGQTALNAADAAKRAAERETLRRLAEDGENGLGLSLDQRRQIQVWLVALGHLSRTGTGAFDAPTRSAIQALQRSLKEPETGYLTASLVQHIAKEGPAVIAAAEAERRLQVLEAQKRAAEAEQKAEEQRLAAEQRKAQELKRLVDGEAALRLSQEQRLEIQKWLLALGHLPRLGDGAIDEATRGAIRSYQQSSGETQTGYLSEPLLKTLQRDGQRAATAARPPEPASPPQASAPQIEAGVARWDGVWQLRSPGMCGGNGIAAGGPGELSVTNGLVGGAFPLFTFLDPPKVSVDGSFSWRAINSIRGDTVEISGALSENESRVLTTNRLQNCQYTIRRKPSDGQNRPAGQGAAAAARPPEPTSPPQASAPQIEAGVARWDGLWLLRSPGTCGGGGAAAGGPGELSVTNGLVHGQFPGSVFLDPPKVTLDGSFSWRALFLARDVEISGVLSEDESKVRITRPLHNCEYTIRRKPSSAG